MTSLTNPLIAIACVWLWVGVVAPAILRTFGVPIAFGVGRVDRRNQHLSKAQYVWAVGVFSYGLGMFLFSTVWTSLWKQFPDRFSHTSPGPIIPWLLVWVAVGWLFGVITAPHRPRADSTAQ